jgi:hypothetical protein
MLWSFDTKYLKGPDGFELLMDFRKLKIVADFRSAVFTANSKLRVTMQKEGDFVQMIVHHLLIMRSYVRFDPSFFEALRSIKDYFSSFKVGSMVKIKDDLRIDARYQIYKIKGTVAKVYHDPSGEYGDVDIRDLEKVDITMKDYQNQVAGKLRGGDY